MLRIKRPLVLAFGSMILMAMAANCDHRPPAGSRSAIELLIGGPDRKRAPGRHVPTCQCGEYKWSDVEEVISLIEAATAFGGRRQWF